MKDEQINTLKEKYPKGTQIVLERMNGENQMPCGLKGTVTHVDDAGQIHMKWENGSSLALNVDEDNENCVICNSNIDEKGTGGIWDLAAEICDEIGVVPDHLVTKYMSVQDCVYSTIRDYLEHLDYCPNCGRMIIHWMQKEDTNE